MDKWQTGQTHIVVKEKLTAYLRILQRSDMIYANADGDEDENKRYPIE